MTPAILLAFAIYLGTGALFGVLFVWRGIERIDPTAHGAPWMFRCLILPGVVALWPMLAIRWAAAARARARA